MSDDVRARVGLNAADVKAALYARHPAAQDGFLGPWTCLEEWENIDFLAVLAWSSIKGYPPHARVGYEVKVSRADYRRELRQPFKRSAAVDWCHVFYFATPAGLLKPEEVAFEEPEEFRTPAAFEREPCPDWCGNGKVWQRDEEGHTAYALPQVQCEPCGGKGYVAKSLVERTAPLLWVPNDVGLIEVTPDGKARVRKKAPVLVGQTVYEKSQDRRVAQLVRYVSVRPDPRHASFRKEPSADDLAA